MAKETSFSHPPGGHIGILLYCPAENEWYIAASDSAGYQIVKVATSTLPDGASTEESLAEVSARLGDETDPATGSVNRQLLNILNELQAKLETTDLKIEAGSKDLQVDVKSAPATDTQVYGWDGAAWEKISSVGDPGPALKVAVGVGGNIAQAANCSSDDIGTDTKLLYTAGFLYGFDGTNWDRLRQTNYALHTAVQSVPTTTVIPGTGEKLVGLSAIVEQSLSDTDISAADTELTGTTVPSGEIWVITAAAIQYTGTVPTNTMIYADGLASGMMCLWQPSPASGRWYFVSPGMVLQAGDNMVGRVLGATLHDVLVFRYAGYKMAAP